MAKRVPRRPKCCRLVRPRESNAPDRFSLTTPARLSTMSGMVITLDGPAGSGKSTVARALAKRLGLPLLNSGYIYRAVTLSVIDAGVDFDDEPAVEALIRALDLRFSDTDERTAVYLSGTDVTDRLRDPGVTRRVYRVANNPFYRTLLVSLQRQTAEPNGVVTEGRDMGTVIFPDAEHKFFLDASPEERARRRHLELQSAGHEASFEQLLKEMQERDRHDRERESAPLRVPDGAVVIETDGLTADEVERRVLDSIRGGSGAAMTDTNTGGQGTGGGQ